MSKVKKRNRYQLTRGVNLYTKFGVNRNGKTEQVYVEFLGTHSPKIVKGTFVTQDQDLIEAIENSPEYLGKDGVRKTIKRIESLDVKNDSDHQETAKSEKEILKEATPVEKKEAVDEPKEDPVPDVNPEEEEDPDPDENIVHDVTTVQEAKSFLIETLGISANKVKNKEFVLQVAEENNIKFPNLQ